MWLLCCEQHPWDPPHCPVIVPTGLRGTTDWSISYPTSLQRERDLALNKALCGKTNDIGLVLDYTFHKPHSHFCKQFTIMRCISVWFLVCVTIQQDHNCICIFSTLKKKKKIFFKGYWWSSITYVPVTLNSVILYLQQQHNNCMAEDECQKFCVIQTSKDTFFIRKAHLVHHYSKVRGKTCFPQKSLGLNCFISTCLSFLLSSFYQNLTQNFGLVMCEYVLHEKVPIFLNQYTQLNTTALDFNRK